ncbi:MAG TPA: hypothetical protein VFM63_10335, partial [Pyrinomonadaceae bacterium]|nr:hypothetical protein [Pyrinomonadaceae bacterium]
MERINAIELLVSGVKKAHADGLISDYDQDDGPDYSDIRATSLNEGVMRTVFVRCYLAERKLSAPDIASVRDAADAVQAKMVLVVG